MIKKVLFLCLLFVSFLNAASNCPDIKDLNKLNDHYYGMSTKRMTFEAAKKFAEQKGGYLAIPNNSKENTFLQNILGGRNGGWLGIYDPRYSSNYSSINPSRFVDINGLGLMYSNWDAGQPDNLLAQYDIYNGVNKVSPLGEHWVAMNGNNGKWHDYGNHFEFEQSIFYALLEFDTPPSCYEDLSSDEIDDTFTPKKCSTQIWDDNFGNLELGTLLDCQTDIYGNDYCPAAVSQCSQEWDYDAGYSLENVTTTVDYTKRESYVDFEDPRSEIKCTQGSYDPITKTCPYGGLYQIALGRDPDIDGYNYWKATFHNPPTYDDFLNFVVSAVDEHNADICGGVDPRYKDALGKKYVAAYLWYLGRCPDPTGFDGWYKLFPVFELWRFIDTATAECSARGACPYMPPLVEIGTPIIINECSLGFHYNSFSNLCEQGGSRCPIGYVETKGTETSKGECKRTIEYTYYNYMCNGEKSEQGYNYSPTTQGGDCKKEDTNKNENNSNELSKPCNNILPPNDNCKREHFLCKANEKRPCSWVENSWQCSPFPCFGDEDIIVEGDIQGVNDKENDGWNEDGSCSGQIYIFNGKDYRCRSSDKLFGLTGGGCCNKDKVFMGLIQCKEDEKMLAKKNQAELCVELGEFCSKTLNLGFTKICIQNSRGNCCFGSKLARVIHEQGRKQLGISWGSAKSPQCRGFTIEEFQKLDFSKIDLSGAFDIPEIDQTQMTDKVNSAISNFRNMLQTN